MAIGKVTIGGMGMAAEVALKGKGYETVLSVVSILLRRSALLVAFLAAARLPKMPSMQQSIARAFPHLSALCSHQPTAPRR